MNIYLKRQEIQEKNGKSYLEISNWSVIKMVVVGNIYAYVVMLGGLVILGILLALLGVSV